MNLIILKDKLLNAAEKIGLTVEEETAESLTMHAQITAKNYFPNNVYCRLVAFSSGTFHLFLTFDEIEKTYDNLFLLNAFNDNNPWFRGYITNIHDKDYLELHYVAIALDKEDDVVDTFGYLLTDILKEDILKYLRPLINNSEN